MKRRVTISLITGSFLLGLILWSSGGQGTKGQVGCANAQALPGLKASVAQIDITPSNNGFPRMFLAGFADRSTDNPGLGTFPGDPGLSARAIAFDDRSCDGNIKVIVTADILGFTRQMRQEILTEVASSYSLPAKNLLLSATHTHNGPVLTDNLDPRVSYPGFSSDGITGSADLVIVDNYTNWLKTALVNLIGTAINGLPNAPEVTLSFGVGFADIGRNRVGIEGNEDNDLPVLAVRSASTNSLVAVLFGATCHPVVAGIAADYKYYYHPDFPGLARARLETNNPGTMAFFIQGAAGDINPDPEAMYDQADKLANVVQDVLSVALLPISGSIKTEVRDVPLPLNMDPEDPNHVQLRAKYDNIRAITENAYLDRHANQMIAQIDTNTLPVNENWPVAVWHFGTNTNALMLAALGGEVVSGYSLYLKGQLRSQLGNTLWIAAYSNEVPGYIPSSQVWDMTGYEAGWAAGPDGGPLVSSFGTSQMYYGWPAPLKRGNSDTGGTVQGVEELVIANTTELIQGLLSPTADTTPPIISCPANITVDLPPNSTSTNTNVSFTVTATDNTCAGATVTISHASGSAFPLGTTTVTATATDGASNTSTCSFTVKVTKNYNFSGFFQPVDNPPTVNTVKAGQSIPVQFSLGENFGLNILASGSPSSQNQVCNGGTPDDIETVTSGNSGLQYDATTNTYTYTWKTDKSWKGQCRQLTVTLSDGTTHTANFQFK